MSEIDDMGFLGANIEVEDIAFGSQFGLIQWVNGQPTGAKGTIQADGGFFLAADQGVEPPPGFEPYTFLTSEGTEVEGFAAKQLVLSPIRFRRCWISEPDGEGLSQRFAWNDYETASSFGKARGVCHIVAHVEGGEEPFLFSFRGHGAKAVMGMGRERGIVPMYGQRIIGQAKRVARKAGKGNMSYPLCAFRLTIGPDADDKGKASYTEVGTGKNTSKITLPVWIDEPDGLVDQALLARLYVGNELFGDLQAVHTDAEEWANKWSPEVLNGRVAGGEPVAAGAEAGAPGAQDVPF